MSFNDAAMTSKYEDIANIIDGLHAADSHAIYSVKQFFGMAVDELHAIHFTLKIRPVEAANFPELQWGEGGTLADGQDSDVTPVKGRG